MNPLMILKKVLLEPSGFSWAEGDYVEYWGIFDEKFSEFPSQHIALFINKGDAEFFADRMNGR